MRSTLRNLMPSMFHRRLLLLAGVMVVVLSVLGTATTMLATGQSHREARALAESKLRRDQMIETKRGAILDRHGLVLAEDEPGWELAVHFDLLTGKWAYRRAYADASRDKLAWGEMPQAVREARVAELQREYDEQTQALFVTLAELSGMGFEAFQERRVATVERVQKLQSYLWRLWQEQESAERGEFVPLDEVAKPIAAEVSHHVLIPDLSDALRLQIEKFIDEGRRAQQSGNAEARSALPWTMVELRRTTVRRYPLDRMTVELDRSTLPGPLGEEEPIEIEVAGVGLHLLGLMRDAWQEDVGGNPLFDRKGKVRLSGYQDGDRLGRSGIEQAMESALRGRRGLRTVNLDTGETISEIEPLPGKDVMLALDIRLQAHVQAVMSPKFGLMQTQPWHLKPEQPQELVGTPLNGAAVVIDIASGDVLAAVSMPEAPRDLLAEEPDLLWKDAVNLPMVNRAVSVPHQPGSTLKTLIVAAAITDGVMGEFDLLDTPGFLWESNPNVYRDWIYKMTGYSFSELEGGPIGAVFAIARSSNVFMGKLAEKMIGRDGLDRLPWWYERFGLGIKPGTGLPEEISGDVGPPNRRLEHNQVCFMAIGQGPVSWTPLQAATAYMRLASGDLSRQARLIVSPMPPPTETQTGPTARQTPAPRLSAAAKRVVLEGMRQGANEQIGTTHHISHAPSGMSNVPIFNVQGVTVMAKSGTAETGNFRWIDFNFNGKPDEGEYEPNPRSHGWVVAVVQPDGAPRPTHAIAVVVEYGGSGGRVAGPIVNQIVHALQRHRYLDWPPTR